MSATMTPPATVDAPLDTAAQRPRDVPAPARIRTGTDVSSSRPSRPSASAERFRYAVFTATWTSGLVVASAVAAVVLAVATPVVMARLMYEERRYR